ncbi:hypothetical protein [Salegentibacter mishustinae]|uniref:hypothetical protein n=1 Tax=Salegentibacter mishustinae TaxID=270918 RepID=UPI0024924E96|nr:hypothetical protein [Salegentibacter mishustinae]
MEKLNKLEIAGLIILAIAGILFLTDKFLKVEFLIPVMEFKEIFLYSGIAIWAIGLMQKESVKRKNSIGNKNG